MVRKEFRQLFRDPRLARMVLVSPMIQLIIFGYAVSTDIRHTRTFVVDHDHTRASRELVRSFTAAGYFKIVGRSERSADLVNAMDHGSATVGIEIPPGFARALTAGGEGATVQVILDGTNSNTATVAQGYAERIVTAYGARVAGSRFVPPVDVRERAWFNPDLASRNYNIPAVVGTIILLVCLLLTSLAVVRERELGTLEQLRVSPLEPWEMIAGKTIPFALIGLLDQALILGAAVLWFHIPFTGALGLLLLASLCFLMTALGLGLFISSISTTQQEAFMSTFLVFQPMMLLSGFMFPVSSMPAAFRWFTLLNPLRHYLEIIRGIFLKGAGLDALWPQYGALLAMGCAVMWLATNRFRRISG
ncbi:MAG: ABC transporter permease [Candidatus Eisenbacteria bacterium]|nr:ABC transporter permease [Candidatus Eisenbacteria bacterium]